VGGSQCLLGCSRLTFPLLLSTLTCVRLLPVPSPVFLPRRLPLWTAICPCESFRPRHCAFDHHVCPAVPLSTTMHHSQHPSPDLMTLLPRCTPSARRIDASSNFDRSIRCHVSSLYPFASLTTATATALIESSRFALSPIRLCAPARRFSKMLFEAADLVQLASYGSKNDGFLKSKQILTSIVLQWPRIVCCSCVRAAQSAARGEWVRGLVGARCCCCPAAALLCSAALRRQLVVHQPPDSRHTHFSMSDDEHDAGMGDEEESVATRARTPHCSRGSALVVACFFCAAAQMQRGGEERSARVVDGQAA
jgi:hypothetical protein